MAVLLLPPPTNENIPLAVLELPSEVAAKADAVLPFPPATNELDPDAMLSAEPAAKESKPDEVLLNPNATERIPETTFCWPDAKLSEPLASFKLPAPTKLLWPDAVFSKPPPIKESSPLAVFPSPPATNDSAPLAVLSWPETKARTFDAVLPSPKTAHSFALTVWSSPTTRLQKSVTL